MIRPKISFVYRKLRRKLRWPSRKIAIVLAAAFGAIAAVSGLLFRATFSDAVLQRYPVLNLVEVYRLPLLAIAVVSGVLAVVFGLWRELSPTRTQEGRGEAATLKAFDNEVDDSLQDAERKARDFFIAGMHDHRQGKLREAVENYTKSVKALPTIAALLPLGWCLWRTSALPAAKGVFEQGLKLAQERRAEERVASFFLNLGGVCAEMGQLDDALVLLKNAERFYGVLKDFGARGQALGNIGLIHYIKGEYSEACNYFRDAFEIFKKHRPEDAAILLGNFGKAKMRLGLPDEAMNLLKLALEAERGFAPDQNARGNFNLSISQILSEQGRYQEAIDYARTAGGIFAGSDNLLGEANAFDALATCLAGLGRLREAEVSLQQAVARHRVIGDHYLGESLTHLGTLLLDRDQFAEAEKILTEALEIVGGRNVPQRAELLMQLGNVMAEVGHFASATQYLQDALAAFANNEYGQAKVNMSIGRLALRQGLFDEAEAAVSRALEWFQEHKRAVEEATALISLASVKNEKGQYGEARHLSERAASILRPLSPANAAGALGNIARTYLREANLPKALECAMDTKSFVEGHLGSSEALDDVIRLIEHIKQQQKKKEAEPREHA